MRAAVRTPVRFCEPAEVCDCNALAIEHDVNVAPVHRDLDVIPFADRFHGVFCRLHQVVNCARVVVARAHRIIDRDLDAIETHVLAGTRREGTRAHENTTVAALADFEVERKTEVFPLLRVHEHIVARFVWVKGAVLNRRARRRAVTVHPTGRGIAIEQQQPAVLLLRIGQFIVRRGERRSCQQRQQ